MNITKGTPQIEAEILVWKLLRGEVKRVSWQISEGLYTISVRFYSLVDHKVQGIPNNWFNDAKLGLRMKPLPVCVDAKEIHVSLVWQIELTSFSFAEKCVGANTSGYWKTTWSRLNRKIQKLTKPYCKNCGQLLVTHQSKCPNCQSTIFVNGIKLE